MACNYELPIYHSGNPVRRRPLVTNKNWGIPKYTLLEKLEFRDLRESKVDEIQLPRQFCGRTTKRLPMYYVRVIIGFEI